MTQQLPLSLAFAEVSESQAGRGQNVPLLRHLSRLADILCGNPDCRKLIPRPRPNQRFCSDRCKTAVWEQENPRLRARDGVARRRKALERVGLRDPEFIPRGLELIRGLEPGDYTGEDIRARCEQAGIRAHHYNAWGAVIMAAIVRGLLTRTGRYQRAKDPRKHAHMNPVYTRRG